jgi:hypothetical protein
VVEKHNESKDAIEKLKKRKLIVQELMKSFKIKKGPCFQAEFQKRAGDLSA